MERPYSRSVPRLTRMRQATRVNSRLGIKPAHRSRRPACNEQERLKREANRHIDTAVVGAAAEPATSAAATSGAASPATTTHATGPTAAHTTTTAASHAAATRTVIMIASPPEPAISRTAGSRPSNLTEAPGPAQAQIHADVVRSDSVVSWDWYPSLSGHGIQKEIAILRAFDGRAAAGGARWCKGRAIIKKRIAIQVLAAGDIEWNA